MSAATGHGAGPAKLADDTAAMASTPDGIRRGTPTMGTGTRTVAPVPPRPPGFARTLARCCARSCCVELRTLESVPGMSLFAVTTFVVFHFALNRNSVEGDLAAGILWVTLLFAAMLGVNRLFVADAEQGGFDGFLLAPVDRSALLLAKALALLALPGRARARRGARLRAAAARPLARPGAARPARRARARRPRRGA